MGLLGGYIVYRAVKAVAKSDFALPLVGLCGIFAIGQIGCEITDCYMERRDKERIKRLNASYSNSPSISSPTVATHVDAPLVIKEITKEVTETNQYQRNCAKYVIEFYTTKLSAKDLAATFVNPNGSRMTSSTMRLSFEASQDYKKMDCLLDSPNLKKYDQMVKTEIHDYWKNAGIKSVETSYYGGAQIYPEVTFTVDDKKDSSPQQDNKMF